MIRLLQAAAAVLVASCAGAPGPGDAGYAFNVDGRYAGRLLVDGQSFDATFDLAISAGGRVRGTFEVRAPLEIEGRAAGMVVDDVLRLTLAYESDARDGGGTCEGRVEGILDITADGAIVDGPVTITDCGDSLAGRLSFRRAAGG